jgi:hypothetical protein
MQLKIQVMEEQIKKTLLEAVPVFKDRNGRDLNKIKRELYEDGVRKGIELVKSQSRLHDIVIDGSYIHVDEIDGKIIITNNEKLKDFEIWKEWRNKS